MSAHSAPGPPDTGAGPGIPRYRAPARASVDARLLESVRESVMSDAGPVTPSRVAAAVQASGRLLGTAGALAAVEGISAELNGLGPLQVLVRDPAVTDIFVNGPGAVWLDRGDGLERAPVAFSGEPQVRALAARLVAAGGRRLDDGSPCVDIRLDGGFRVHAVLPPISTAGTLLSIRIRRERVFSMDELRRNGMFGALVQTVLERMVAAPLELPDQRRHRVGEDHAARHAPRLVFAGRAARPDRRRLGAEPGPPARCFAGGAARQPRRRRRRGLGRARAAVTEDAAGPAGGGGVPRCRSAGTAGCHEHRPQRGRRNHPRQHRGRRARHG